MHLCTGQLNHASFSLTYSKTKPARMTNSGMWKFPLLSLSPCNKKQNKGTRMRQVHTILNIRAWKTAHFSLLFVVLYSSRRLMCCLCLDRLGKVKVEAITRLYSYIVSTFSSLDSILLTDLARALRATQLYNNSCMHR
jgi:hypothetical protein